MFLKDTTQRVLQDGEGEIEQDAVLADDRGCAEDIRWWCRDSVQAVVGGGITDSSMIDVAGYTAFVECDDLFR